MKRTTKRILTCCAMLLLAFVPLLSARADSEGLITGNMVNLRPRRAHGLPISTAAIPSP